LDQKTSRPEGKMSYKTRQQAMKRAKEVMLMLDDPMGWQIMVHKNIYWYFKLFKASLSLHEDFNGHFYTLLSTDEYPSGG
jgi:hypothetical protein